MANSFAPHWQVALALDRREAPEFYKSAAEVEPGPHAEAIRYVLLELGLAAVFCIEGVPTIGFFNSSDSSLDRIDELHRILWNQGLISLLLVLKEDELTAYSLVKRPFQREEGHTSDPRLIMTLSRLQDALKLRELIDAAESGRFWLENDEFFDPSERVDSVLLSNLLEAFRCMRDELGGEAAQALLMQTMFIAYLEDRKIIEKTVFQDASNNKYSTFADMLEASSPESFEALFVWLKKAFNGNLFNAPCSFETGNAATPKLSIKHLQTLARFRHGREEMSSGQLRLWGYDFQYISIGLISAVYDRFLKEESDKKAADGAFYTPMFLADFVVNQLWDELSDEQRINGIFCDPACGSGIFLVRMFQRLVSHHCRINNQNYASWEELKTMARRLYGGDINSSAVRVAAFSLYIALLEQSNPPDLPSLIKTGKLLPPLYGDTLLPASDFFQVPDSLKFDAVIGNPPWKGRSGLATTAQKWSKTHGYPDPEKEIAWGFIWKALTVVKKDGLVAFLVPAMGVLHNTSGEEARKRLLRDTRIRRIVNLSDLCFQLFDGAQRPTAFLLYAPPCDHQLPYRFEYWVPKADLNLRLKRLLSLSRADCIKLRSDLVDKDPTLFKRRLWTRGPEEKLLQYLRTIRPLSKLVREYKNVRKAKIGIDRTTDWIIGQGFKPAQEDRNGDPEYDTTVAEVVTRYPYLSSNSFQAIALPVIEADPWPTSVLHRAGFPEGFPGPHILIPQGVERATGRVRAAYCEQDVVFQHSIQAIAFPETEKHTAKVLTAVLNSSLAAWVYFHDTANLGTDRAKVHQGELLKLPFDMPSNMPDPARAAAAGEKIIKLVNREISNSNKLLSMQFEPFGEIDKLVFDYYGLDAPEAALIEDTLRYLIPAMQPRRSAGLQKIWDNSRVEHRAEYAAMLCEALKPCFRQPVEASLAARSSDIAVLKLAINPHPRKYSEELPSEAGEFLKLIQVNLPVRLPGNVQLVPDLRFVIDSDMYLVKPMQLRHWLRSTALADAEQIAADFSAAVARHSQRGEEHAGR